MSKNGRKPCPCCFSCPCCCCIINASRTPKSKLTATIPLLHAAAHLARSSTSQQRKRCACFACWRHHTCCNPAAIPKTQAHPINQHTGKTSIRTHVINVLIVAHPQATAPLHLLLAIETAPSPFCGMRPHLAAPTTWNEAEWQWVSCDCDTDTHCATLRLGVRREAHILEVGL